MNGGPRGRVPGAWPVLLGLLVVVSGCVGIGGLWPPGAVVPLAKVEGWRQDLGRSQPPFAILEIAYDEETAARAWEENVPEGLRERTGDPERPGLYGDLAAVDFDEEVVAVWSSGESSSCPGWLGGIDTDAAGTVHVERDDASGTFGACTDDYTPYRMILAVDRGHVPSPDMLPTEDVVGVPDTPGAGGLVTSYPADDPVSRADRRTRPMSLATR